MGLLSRLFTFSVAAPIGASRWAIETVLGAAEAELYDEDQIIAELRALAEDVDEGRISEREHAAAEALLLERLQIARQRRREADA